MRMPFDHNRFRGQTSLEYLLLLSVVAVVVIASFGKGSLVDQVHNSAGGYYNTVSRVIMDSDLPTKASGGWNESGNPKGISGGWCPVTCPPSGSSGFNIIYRACECPSPAFGGSYCQAGSVGPYNPPQPCPKGETCNGPEIGCNGTVACGPCPTGEICNSTGQCVCPNGLTCGGGSGGGPTGSIPINACASCGCPPNTILDQTTDTCTTCGTCLVANSTGTGCTPINCGTNTNMFCDDTLKPGDQYYDQCQCDKGTTYDPSMNGGNGGCKSPCTQPCTTYDSTTGQCVAVTCPNPTVTGLFCDTNPADVGYDTCACPGPTPCWNGTKCVAKAADGSCNCTPNPGCGGANCGQDSCGTPCGNNGGSCPQTGPGTNQTLTNCSNNAGPTGPPGTCVCPVGCGSSSCNYDTCGDFCGGCPTGQACSCPGGTCNATSGPGVCSCVNTVCTVAFTCGSNLGTNTCGGVCIGVANECPLGETCDSAGVGQCIYGTCSPYYSCGSSTGFDAHNTPCTAIPGTCNQGYYCDMNDGPPHCTCKPSGVCIANHDCGSGTDGTDANCPSIPCNNAVPPGGVNCENYPGDTCDLNDGPPHCVCKPSGVCIANHDCGPGTDGTDANCPNVPCNNAVPPGGVHCENYPGDYCDLNDGPPHCTCKPSGICVAFNQCGPSTAGLDSNCPSDSCNNATTPGCAQGQACNSTGQCVACVSPINGTCTAWGACSSTSCGVSGTQTCTVSTAPECAGASAIGTTQSCTGNTCASSSQYCNSVSKTCVACTNPINGNCTSWGPCSATACGVSGTQTCLMSSDPQCGGATAAGTTQACLGDTMVNGTCTYGTCSVTACGQTGTQTCIGSTSQCGGTPAVGSMLPCIGTACQQGTCYNNSCCSPVSACASSGFCGTNSDGCGGNCTCPTSQTCDPVSNRCVVCTPQCANAVCGADNGCGGKCTGGSCPTPNTCGGGGVPNQCGCTPTTCAALGDTCGSVPDGCGGTLSCGSCSGQETCGGAGVPNQCGCKATTCAALKDNCGNPPDGCGGTLSCGACTGQQTCGGGGTPFICGGCTPSPACGNNSCSSDSCGDLCGNNGGVCSPGLTCNASSGTPGQCTATFTVKITQYASCSTCSAICSQFALGGSCGKGTGCQTGCLVNNNTGCSMDSNIGVGWDCGNGTEPCLSQSLVSGTTCPDGVSYVVSQSIVPGSQVMGSCDPGIPPTPGSTEIQYTVVCNP